MLCSTGCGGKEAAEPVTAPTEPVTAPTEPRSPVVPMPLGHARRFEIHDHDGIVTVDVKRPWQGSNSNFRYVLVPHGKPIPDGVDPRTVVRIPVQRIVSMSTSFLPSLEMLHALDRLVGVSRIPDISSPTVLERIKSANLAEVGPVTNVNREAILELAPDAVFTFGVNAGDLAGFEPIIKSGIPVVLAADYMEETPLGRAEWIKFFALFVGKWNEANALYQDIESRYTSLVALAQKAGRRPTVMLESSYQGTWFVPGGRSYVAQFLRDAGANYLWADDQTQGSLRLGFEAVLERGHGADFWLNTGTWRSVADAVAQDPRYLNFRPLAEGRTYNHNARTNSFGGNDFFETGPARPDLVLADLIKIFHPELMKEHTLFWYRQLDPRIEKP
ncbi:MAG: ABC transporter substrate-binding protein [Planctomycetota bacterium]